MDYERFISLVNTLDPMTDQCAVNVNRLSLLSMEQRDSSTVERNNRFFANHQVVSLTREDVFAACAGNNLENGLLSVLYWGFPKNQRGRCQNVLHSYELIVQILQDYRNVDLTFQQYEDLKNEVFVPASGVGIAFFSKLLYFCNIRLNGNPCVIYDSRVINKIQECLSNEAEFNELRNSLHVGNTYQAYWNYVQAVAPLAPVENDVIRSDKVEYVLWL